MNYNTFNLVGAAVLGATAPGIAFAQDTAVGSINGKLSFGYTDSESATQPSGGFALGSLSFPVTSTFGVQIDVGTDRLDTSANQLDGTNGLGIHLFTRDPSSYLVGVYAHVVNADTAGGSLRNERYGLEGELYLDDYSIQAFVGVDEVSGIGAATRFDSVDVAVSRYLGEMTMVTLGAERAFDATNGYVGVEYMTPIAGVQTSLFGEASFGDSDTQLTAGVSMYFGNGDMSLKQIHRENDPPNRLGSIARGGYFEALSAGALTLPQQPPQKFR